MKKTTQTQFKEFRKHCEYWHERLGLGEYELHVRWSDSEKDNARSFTMHKEARIVVELGKKLDKSDLKTLALHEMLHGTLASLSAYAMDSRAEWIVQEEEHKIINHIIKAIK